VNTKCAITATPEVWGCIVRVAKEIVRREGEKE